MSHPLAVCRRVPTTAWFFGSLLILISMEPALAQAPAAKNGSATGAAKSLARFVPQKDLVFCAEFDGLKNRVGVWKKTEAYGLLNDTKLGPVVEDIVAQLLDQPGSGPPATTLKGKEIVPLLERVFDNGIILSINGKGGKDTNLLIAIRGGAQADLRKLIDDLINAQYPPKTARETVKKGARSISVMGKGDDAKAILDEQGDLVICSAASLDHVLAVIDGKEPNATANPIRVDLMKTEGRFQPVGWAFLDMAQVTLPKDAEKLGIGGLKRIELRWGIHDEALSTVIRLIAPSPRAGLLGLFDQPTFEKTSLPYLLPKLTAFTQISVDPDKLYDQVIELKKATHPQGEVGVAAEEAALNKALGLDFKTELLSQLGSRIAMYTYPTVNPRGVVVVPLLDYVITWELHNSAATAKALDKLMPALNTMFAAKAGQNGQTAPGAPVPQFAPHNGALPSHVLTFPEGTFPPGPLSVFQPTIIVGQDRMVIAGRPAIAEAAIALVDQPDKPWTATGAFVPMSKLLPTGLVFLSVTDPRETFPGLIAGLPGIVQGINLARAKARAQAKALEPAPKPGDPPRVEPRPFQVSPTKLPAAADLTKRLFPSSLAVSVDRQGIRIALREPIPTFTSPGTAGIVVALMLPAVQSAREAARKAKCSNNLKEIGLALLNHHEAKGGFPKAAITDIKGKPLLSWRVAILPFLGQQALYDKFKLDQPWDSPANLQLLQSMPDVFACQSGPRRDPSTTCYRVFVDKGALWESNNQVKISQIPDGTATTLAVVEARDSVPWTKPEELLFDPAGEVPLLGAGSAHHGGFYALFADGSARFLPASIDPKLLRAMITRAGAEIIQSVQPAPVQPAPAEGGPRF
jgi:Protein of unknown function (DUF1559)